MSAADMKNLISASSHVVIVQADNPDADSLGSSLALEAILSEQGKQVSLYCAVDMPDYLKYMPAWSRVNNMLPNTFDAAIIVDASVQSLFERAIATNQFQLLKTKPVVVLDHHSETANDLDFAKLIINRDAISSTCELIMQLADEADWVIPRDACDPLMTGILGDTQGLSNQLTSADTYQAMAKLVTLGADRPKLEEARRQYSKMVEQIYRFKAALIERTQFEVGGALALVTISHDEVKKYSPHYNPGPLIQPDMLQVEGVKVGIVFKLYDDGRITAMIRCNNGAEIGDKLAAHFGGGGHKYAAGFKVTDGTSFEVIKSHCIEQVTTLLHAQA